MRTLLVIISGLLMLSGCNSTTKQTGMTELQNPILPGYFADPSIVEHEGKFYMYVTADPWGAEFLSCWVSDDFRNWTFNALNWPTKAACTSPTSNGNMVWAPSVVKKGNQFYMYISVGSEVWCGTAEHPLGPWQNMLGDKPMLEYDTTRHYHVIDAEAFIDDDGRSYLYWGSGWEWINGHCYAAELNEDMRSFKSEMVEVTPTHYFEGPLMIKHDSKYYLTYSEGKTIDETYEVRYAVGDNPLGPFTEAENSPILKTREDLHVYGPGHHTIFAYGGQNYILYHRHRLPFEKGTAYRQTCINELHFDDAKQQIKGIIPEHTQLFPDLAATKINYIHPVAMTTNSEEATYTEPKYAMDNNYSTLWAAREDDKNVWITAEFAPETSIGSMEIRFEYPWKTYYPKVEASTDNENWEVIADYSIDGVSGSPVIVPVNKKTRFIRLAFDPKQEIRAAVWELYFY